MDQQQLRYRTDAYMRKPSGIFYTDRAGTNKFSHYGVEMRLKKLSIATVNSKKFEIF
jgi:hypothetical protein